MTALYVIGNGFDLHHGMRTAYKDFGAYFKCQHRDLYGEFETYFDVNEQFWSRFEDRLAEFDADTLANNYTHTIKPYTAENWNESDNHNYAFELDRVVKALSEGLLKIFTQWIRTIEIPTERDLTAPLERIDPKGRFLTFNYTATLQKLYRVPDEKVWHIHGAAHRQADRLVLGHGWRPKRAERSVARLDPESADPREMEGAKILDLYFKKTFKPTDTIIADHKAWFENLASVNDVRVLGHSLSDVDLPYLAEVKRCVHSDATWRISTRGDPDGLRRQVAKFAPTVTASFHTLPEV
jgi:hypothetical protein